MWTKSELAGIMGERIFQDVNEKWTAGINVNTFQLAGIIERNKNPARPPRKIIPAEKNKFSQGSSPQQGGRSEPQAQTHA